MNSKPFKFMIKIEEEIIRTQEPKLQIESVHRVLSNESVQEPNAVKLLNQLSLPLQNPTLPIDWN